MRISTSMVFDAGVSSINQQMAHQLKLQQQVAMGKNLLTPSDDPVAAAQALQVRQANDINAQYATNLDNANSALGFEEAQFQALNDFFGRVTELATTAEGSGLTAANKSSIAVELRTRFDQLMNIANSTDGTGQYLFSGYQGSTRPFAGSVDGLIANPGTDITYQGDDGQRTLGISSSNQLAVSDSGADVFMRIASGNGYFTTNYAAGNTGTGIISTGSVTDPAAWSSFANKPLSVSFSGGGTTYTVTDSASNVIATGPYHAGDAIAPAGTGISFTITGAPVDGDTFTVAASQSQSIFRTLANLIGALENPASGAAADAKFQADVNNALVNLDQARQNVLRIHGAIGGRLNEVTSQQATNGSFEIQYAKIVSVLEGSQESDKTKAISDLTAQQTQLQAALQSFASVSKLSLFNYL